MKSNRLGYCKHKPTLTGGKLEHPPLDRTLHDYNFENGIFTLSTKLSVKVRALLN